MSLQGCRGDDPCELKLRPQIKSGAHGHGGSRLFQPSSHSAWLKQVCSTCQLGLFGFGLELIEVFSAPYQITLRVNGQ